MRRIKANWVVFGAALSIIAGTGCAKDEGELSPEQQAIADNSPLGADDPQICTPLTAISGVWESECSDMGSGNFGIIRITTGCTSTASQLLMHSDADCGTATWSVTKTMTYTLGDTVTVASGDGTTYEIDLVQTGFSAKAHSEGQADDFNTASECGVETWASGVSVDTAGKTCDTIGSTFNVDETDNDVPENATETFNIVQIDDTETPTQLRMGDTNTTDHDTSTAAKRPEDVSVDMVIEKQ